MTTKPNNEDNNRAPKNEEDEKEITRDGEVFISEKAAALSIDEPSSSNCHHHRRRRPFLCRLAVPRRLSPAAKHIEPTVILSDVHSRLYHLYMCAR
jgi:hypothetical protein